MLRSRKYNQCGFKAAFFLATIFFSLMPFHSISGARDREENMQENKKKLILGSQPPVCANKCFNCRPCLASLVIKHASSSPSSSPSSSSSSSSLYGDDDDSEGYYLLTWKCRCGDKLFQP